VLRHAAERDLPTVDELTVECYRPIQESYVAGFVTVWLVPEQDYGHIDNNGVRADRTGVGWATFMYREALQFFRSADVRASASGAGAGPR
jgi:ribosomal protein S18 acetylase RimI-like enzyme